MEDGTILRVGPNYLYTRAAVNSGCYHVPKSIGLPVTGGLPSAVTFTYCPYINIPLSHGVVGKVTYTNSVRTVGTKVYVYCPYNPLWYSVHTSDCKENGQWDKDVVYECRNQGDSDSDFRLLPETFDRCPSLMYLSKEDCRKAALSLGGKLKNGSVADISVDHLPLGCSIQRATADTYYNNRQGENNGKYKPVCNKGSFTLLPKIYRGGCPSLMNVSKEDCVAAGLSAGGKLRNGNLVEGRWSHVPFGCSLINVTIHYNSNINGINNGVCASLCHELPVSDIDTSLLYFFYASFYSLSFLPTLFSLSR